MNTIPDIRLPELSGGSEAEQLQSLQRYLYRLAEQLQFAFNAVTREQENQQAISAPEKTPAQTFASIKSLIVKSADVVEAVAEQTERKLEGSYVAQSEFGSFRQETQQHLTETDRELEQRFRNLQEISSTIEQVQSTLLEVNAYIRTGLLYQSEEGSPIYGVEIGQQDFVDGALCFRKFARLTSDRLSFYDSNDTEVAYISDYQLHVTGAQIYRLATEETSARQLHLGDYTWSAGYDGHLSLN